MNLKQCPSLFTFLLQTLGICPCPEGKAHCSLSQGQHGAARVNSNLSSAPLALTLGGGFWQHTALLSELLTFCHTAQAPWHWGGGWGSRMEESTEQSWEGGWLWQFSGCFSTLSSLFPKQVWALPVAAAVTQLGKCVNSN